MLRPAAAVVAVVLAFSLGACGERATADDASFHSSVVNGRAGDEVTFDGSLTADPQPVGGHEHLLLAVPTGDNVEVDHNTKLAPWVPARQGDSVVVHGRLYIDPKGPGIHCTHSHTSSGCPQPGWISLRGSYYE